MSQASATLDAKPPPHVDMTHMKADAALVLERQKKLMPELKFQGTGHRALTIATPGRDRPAPGGQVYSVNTGDESLSGPLLEFFRSS